MAITVKLQDATIALGGNFADALAYLKSFNGRRYDGATKTWTVPQTLRSFGGSFPYDVISSQAQPHRSGEHVTRWGTRYSRNDWDAKRAIDGIRVPAEIMARCAAREQDAEQALIATLAGLGMTAETIRTIRALYSRFVGDLDEAVACGKIKFSSPERRRAIEAAFDAYEMAYDKASDEANAYRENEERRISDEYGY